MPTLVVSALGAFRMEVVVYSMAGWLVVGTELGGNSELLLVKGMILMRMMFCSS